MSVSSICWTQERIAEELGVGSKATIKSIIDSFKMTTTGQIEQTWNLSSNHDNYDKTKPFRYNIWNFAKITNETRHPGSSAFADHHIAIIVLIECHHIANL